MLSRSRLQNELKETKEELQVKDKLLEDSENFKPDTYASLAAKTEKKLQDDNKTKLRRVPVKSLQHLYINNQFIFRGINVRADELISRGYKIEGNDEEGVKACEALVKRSGGENLFWQYSVNTDVGGDGYLEKVLGDDGKKIALLRHVNPINFGYLTDISGNIILNDNKFPKAYMQVYTDEEGKEVKKEIDKSRISHLMFNTFTDEFNGVSSIQPVYNTTVRLMNMEQSAAEAAVKTANPLLVGKTETKSLKDLSRWTNVLGRISGKEQVFLPNGVDLKMLSPGTQNFNDYAGYFLDAVVAALGVPKSILTGSSGASSGNRGTVQIQSRHLYNLIRANQRYVEHIFNEIFVHYARIAGFEAPKLKFNEIAEDADRNNQKAMELFQAGILTIEEARAYVGLETTEAIKKDLSVNDKNNDIKSKNGEDADLKESDKKAFFPPTPGSVEGSQKNNKKDQKINPDVKSVKATPKTK